LLHVRILAALVFTPALLGAIWRGGWVLQGVCFGLSLLLLAEYSALVLSRIEPAVRLGILLVGGLSAAASLGWLSPPLADLSAHFGCILLLGVVLCRPKPLAQTMQTAGLAALGIGWCTTLIPQLAVLRDAHPAGLGLSLLAVLCTWVSDTGAYAAGRLFGRTKLYPAVSPSKTWEGAGGGLAAALGVGYALGAILPQGFSPAWGALLGGACAILGLVGDLCESMLKRSVGAKDSSRLIPGHGGVFDRFDGIVFAVAGVRMAATWILPAP
jgi:phosphatidate cytidylyltransferase